MNLRPAERGGFLGFAFGGSFYPFHPPCRIAGRLSRIEINYFGLKPEVFLRKSLLLPPLRSGPAFISPQYCGEYSASNNKIIEK
ncbi:MAG: hypothetical protein HY813_00660 [Candidatus Portnoybacteria bacterium]|nr:hypothetical protein [Candidatus Portnoybacteria bacterium]